MESLTKDAHLITDTLSQGDTKFMGVCKLPEDASAPYRRLDIRLLPFDTNSVCSELAWPSSVVIHFIQD